MGWLTASTILIIGLIALTLGGDWLVRAASRISQALGVPPLVIYVFLAWFVGIVLTRWLARPDEERR